jgi:CheY-like chemotaxis protein
MAKIVVVDRNRSKTAELGHALGAAGHKVVIAYSASLALTALERAEPDLVVAGAESDDLTGSDLCAIMRADPNGRERLFLLLADGPAATATAGVDLFLPESAEVPEIVGAVAAMLRGEPVDAVPRPRSLRGSLGVMDLAEITQAISISGKTGHLTASLAAGEAVVWFVSGRAVHAQFHGLDGERAFHALIAAAHEDDGDFCFDPVDPAEAQSFPKTIARSVDQLLLIVAADIDEGHAAARGPEEER